MLEQPLNRQERLVYLRQKGYKNYQRYLRSDMWTGIRNRMLKKNPGCFICGGVATQVHHRAYTKANLMGCSLRGLISICNGCHYDIEFDEYKKVPLSRANREMKRLKKERVSVPPCGEEIRQYEEGLIKGLRGDIIKIYLRTNDPKTITYESRVNRRFDRLMTIATPTVREWWTKNSLQWRDREILKLLPKKLRRIVWNKWGQANREEQNI